MDKLSVRDLSFAGKRVLIRVDFNVPLEGTRITDDTRIRGALPTIKHVLEQNGRAILMSHLGRPEGIVNPKYSLKPVADRLAQLLHQPVPLTPDCVGAETKALIDALHDGQVLLLENLRFHAEEKANDPEFSKQLASLGELYVNDAFGAAHRAHASIEGITRYMDSCAAGYLMEQEIQSLSAAFETPKRPFLAILGGAKVSEKIDVIRNFLQKADELIIGGGMAYTFLRAQGREVGDSLVEWDKLVLARDLLKLALDTETPIYFPIDHVIADRFAPDAERLIVIRHCIPEGWQGMDIGPSTIEKFKAIVRKARTIVWNGPLGVFEFDEFARGTTAIARAVAESSAYSIIGGGDCVAAVQKAGVALAMSHISTGGGASLDFFAGKTLPGIAALTDRR